MNILVHFLRTLGIIKILIELVSLEQRLREMDFMDVYLRMAYLSLLRYSRYQDLLYNVNIFALF